MEAIKKKYNTFRKLISFEKSKVETKRREYMQLKKLLEKAELKEVEVGNAICVVEERIKEMILEFDNGTIDVITQCRLYIDKKYVELHKQRKETHKIQELYNSVSNDLNTKLLKLQKLEEKNEVTFSSLKLEIGKSEMKRFDDMWLQRVSRS